MTAREFKDRLAAGDKLAVVMHALWETEERKGRSFNMARKESRKSYENDAAHILAALASAEVKRT